MGIKNAATTMYMRNNKVFADAFNYVIYDGRPVIDPASLVELDTQEIEVPYGGAEGAEQPVQRTRDVIKSVTAMTDQHTAFLILAIENQSNIHYAMPVKNMMYDALQYTKQVEQAIASHKKSGDYRGAGSDEFLSGFMKRDRLMPVVTLAVYFDEKVWDGPMSIHEMFGDQKAEILSLVPDYRINLIAPAMIPDEDFDKFSTTLREVLAFIKYSKDGNRLKQILDTDPNFHNLGRTEVNVLNNCVNANLTIKEGEEVADVCLAIQMIADQAAKEAAAKEAEKTEAAVKEAAKEAAKGAEEKRISMLIDNVRKLMTKLSLTAEQSMDLLEVSVEDRERLARFPIDGAQKI